MAVPAAPATVAEATSSTPEKAHLISKKQAVVLGIVEGLTEYLPVSSTSHLILAQHFMRIKGMTKAQTDSIDAYLVIIQFGAILAVLLLYFGRVRQVFSGLVGRNPNGLRLFVNLIVAFLPAVVIGLLFESKIKEHLFGIWPSIIAWGVGGLVILYMAWRQRKGEGKEGIALDQLAITGALMIGLLQCVAMWPGVSRSLATILGGLLVGMSMSAAVEFSFLLGMLTLTAASLHDFMKYHHVISHNLGIINPLIGMVFAGVAAFIAVKWMVGYLNKHGLALFGYYRIALAVVVLGLVLARVLS
jgi:undecaprenyl-diphosphatase